MGDVRQKQLPNMAGGEGGFRPAASSIDERGNRWNIVERGGHELLEVTYIRFELLDKENGSRRWEFAYGRISVPPAPMADGELRFPAVNGSELVGSRLGT